jgi:Ulp1 family protease
MDKVLQLTEDDLNKVQSILGQDTMCLNSEEVVSTIDGRYPMKRKDIYRCKPLEWLNDEVINAYIHLVVSRCQPCTSYAYTSFFFHKLFFERMSYNYEDVKRYVGICMINIS